MSFIDCLMCCDKLMPHVAYNMNLTEWNCSDDSSLQPN